VTITWGFCAIYLMMLAFLRNVHKQALGRSVSEDILLHSYRHESVNSDSKVSLDQMTIFICYQRPLLAHLILCLFNHFFTTIISLSSPCS
jgi:hypothetical protein